MAVAARNALQPTWLQIFLRDTFHPVRKYRYNIAPDRDRPPRERNAGDEACRDGKGGAVRRRDAVMSDLDKSFHLLIEQIKQGSHEAARELAETYGPCVQRYVRRWIRRDLRNRFDSLDFVQLVWASFFCDPDKVPALESPEQLVAYLNRMAQHKVIDEGRRQDLLKSNVRREERLAYRGDFVPIYGRDPTPSAVAIFQEEYDALVTRQPEQVGRVAQLRFEGATYEEIADELQISERHARRAIARLGAERSLPKGEKPPAEQAAGS